MNLVFFILEFLILTHFWLGNPSPLEAITEEMVEGWAGASPRIF